LIKILVYFLTADMNPDDISDGRDELILRENAAKLLARIAVK